MSRIVPMAVVIETLMTAPATIDVLASRSRTSRSTVRLWIDILAEAKKIKRVGLGTQPEGVRGIKPVLWEWVR